MGDPDLRPIPFKSLPSLFHRLLPSIFEYARLSTQPGGEIGGARRPYVAHVRALRAYLLATARAAGIDAMIVDPLVRRCESLARLRGEELMKGFAALLDELQSVYRAHRQTVKDAIADQRDIFRGIHASEITRLRILAIHDDDTWPRAERLSATLKDGCWYESRRHRARHGMIALEGVDVVLFAPGVQPLSYGIEERVRDAGLPVLVLAGWSRRETLRDMGELRTEHWYRRAGFDILGGPFTPARLYSAIDTLHLRHLARQAAEVELAATAG